MLDFKYTSVWRPAEMVRGVAGQIDKWKCGGMSE